jgi:predicted HicB family RNase H-like nuclease
MGFYVEKKEYVNKTFRIEKKDVEEMEKICAQKNISMNNLVSQCIKFALTNLEEKD